MSNAIENTATPAVTVTATDWPGYGHLPGRRDPVSIPGTADLLVDGTQVTVGLHWDVGGTEQPYVADAPEELTLAECDEIDRVVAAAWDAHGREAA